MHFSDTFKRMIMNKFFISGAGGFIGKAIASYYNHKGIPVQTIDRNVLMHQPDTLAEMLHGADALINLAGAPISRRWTRGYKKVLYNSRMESTRNLVMAMHKTTMPPRVFLCASATGIYPLSGSFTETSHEVADNFLGTICKDWEEEARLAPAATRTANLRFGLVLGKNGGALKKMLTPFKLGLGGAFMPGSQMMPWVHLEDVVRIIDFCLANTHISGPVNVCAPNPVSNRVFTQTLAKTLKRPAIIPIPSFVPKALLGEGSIILTHGQAVYPKKLLDAGYSFLFPELSGALEEIVL